MSDPTVDVAAVLGRITVSYADGTTAENPLLLILEEEGPEALVQAVLDAATQVQFDEDDRSQACG